MEEDSFLAPPDFPSNYFFLKKCSSSVAQPPPNLCLGLCWSSHLSQSMQISLEILIIDIPLSLLASQHLKCPSNCQRLPTEHPSSMSSFRRGGAPPQKKNIQAQSAFWIIVYRAYRLHLFAVILLCMLKIRISTLHNVQAQF